MHESVMAWGNEMLTEGLIRGADVLDVGSYDVNGSWRGLAMRYSPASYVGVDFRMGPGVDRVANAEELPALFPDGFDVVFSTEVLEHAERWREALTGMWSVVRPRGVLMVTCRGPGFAKHDFPHDYWRFTPELLKRCFPAEAAASVRADPQVPGVFLWARKPARGGLLTFMDEPVRVY